MKKNYVIEKPSHNGVVYNPGLKVSLTDDRSLVELYHYYDDEVTQIVGVRTKDISKLIESLHDIDSFLHGEMTDKITIELDRVRASNLGWLLQEQVKSLKNLQREEGDEMQPVIDDFQSIADILLEKLGDLVDTT